MDNPTIQTDIAEILKDLQQGQKEILKELSDVKINLETVKGNIKALDTKVEQLDKRLANQEFLNRGIFIGLLLALLGGIINAFGWIPKN
jgi:predicted  nucleic acid-binding Zn-ribbon protein